MEKNLKNLSKNLKSKPFIFSAATLLLLGVFSLAPASRTSPSDTGSLEASRTHAASLLIEAQSALAMRISDGKILFEKNKDEVRPLASLTKIVSALAILRFSDPAEEIEVSASAVKTPEPSSLRVGEHMSVRSLLAMAMVESSNDAIMALAERLGDVEWFLRMMDETAQLYGARGMQFYSPTGLDVSMDQAGGYGSAADLLAIVTHSLDTPLWELGNVREVVSREGFVHVLRATNAIDADITPLIGAKTGYTDLAGGNLLIITEYPIGQPLGVVVLGSSLLGRFTDVQKILEWIKEQ